MLSIARLFVLGDRLLSTLTNYCQGTVFKQVGVVVPTISATGTGRSVYYSRSDLMALAAMEYCLSVGLSFETAATALKRLYEQEPEFANPKCCN